MTQGAPPRHGPGGSEEEKPSRKKYWDERLQEFWGPHGVGSLAYGRHCNGWLYRVTPRMDFRGSIAECLRLTLS